MKVKDIKIGETYVKVSGENDAYVTPGTLVKIKDIENEGSLRICIADGEEWFLAPSELAELPKTNQETVSPHYVSKHQPIETMQANMTHEEMIGFLKGNIIKYACRCGRKDEPLKEAKKIKQYAEWLVEILSGGIIDPRKI